MVIFIHIPRTAGIAMSSIFDEMYSGFVWTDANQIKSGWLPSTTNCVQGHFGFGIHEQVQIPGRVVVCVTMLRNPVQRMASLHSFGQRIWKGKNAVPGFYKGIPLEAFLELPLCVTDNGMVRQLAGLEFGEIERDRQVAGDDYETALNNLKRFAAFGITEMFQASIRMFAEALFWDRVPAEVVDNTSHPDPPTAAQTELILQLNHWDDQLYQEAFKIFIERRYESIRFWQHQ
jgi:hypothetical protein